MSGQDGSARALLNVTTETDTVLGGFNLRPAPRWKLAADLAWNESRAAAAPFRFDVPAEFLNANQSYDFSLTYLASDIDLTQWEGALDLEYSFADDRWIGFEYRHAEVEDDAPYLIDYTGSFDLFALSVGWRVN